MFDFTLTEEQKAFKGMVRKFAEKEIKPIIAEADAIQDPRKTWSLVGDVMKKGLQLGFGKIMIPEKYGGAGGGIFELEILTEELATVDHGIAMNFTLCAVLPLLVCTVGTEEQIKKWVLPTAQDETGKYIWAMSTTEPSGGSEIFCPLADPALGVRVTATRDGDGYRLNGQKSWTTNAGKAENYVVLARTDKNKPNTEGCSFFIYSKDTPGKSFGKIEDKMGNRTIRNGEIYFDDMWIPKENLLGKEGKGLETSAEFFKRNAVGGTTGAAIGLARSAFNDALKYSRERVIWGQQIIEHPAVAKKLVSMKMKIETCKAMVEKSMWVLENPSLAPGLDKMAALAKMYATIMLPEVTTDAMYILGGYGYSREFPMERYMRDALASRIFEGNNDMWEWFISRDLDPIM
jgi:alkylation response protein AidB-like acyl-CoA dehydrogenase